MYYDELYPRTTTDGTEYIRKKASGDEEITKIKEAFRKEQNKNSAIFNLRRYSDVWSKSGGFKRCLAIISQRTSRNCRDESCNQELYLLAVCEPRYRKKIEKEPRLRAHGQIPHW